MARLLNIIIYRIRSSDTWFLRISQPMTTGNVPPQGLSLHAIPQPKKEKSHVWKKSCCATDMGTGQLLLVCLDHLFDTSHC